jgi:hypothetical protein
MLSSTVLCQVDRPLVIDALGDPGGAGSALRGISVILNNMRTGEHDGGVPSLLLFLGDNFGDIGLNVAATSVGSEANKTLDLFYPVIRELGRDNVHGVPGETEYYSRKAVETTALFGLVTLSQWPVGLTDRGARRAAELLQWRFHASMPGSIVRPVNDGSGDSVEIVFFDSALLLRTGEGNWKPALDSLASLMRRSASRSNIRWRILVTHHPLHSVGEHGGYGYWNDDDSTVAYENRCDIDSNAYAYVRNWVDPEDLCTKRYQSYIHAVSEILRSTVQPQIILSSHDQSLQALDLRQTPLKLSAVQVVDGSSSTSGLVRLPLPPVVFTASRKSEGGKSLPGFAQISWRAGMLHLVFWNGRNGEKVDMGNGVTDIAVDHAGTLQAQKQ